MKVNVTIDTTLTGELKSFNKIALCCFVREILGYDVLGYPVRIFINSKPIMSDLPAMFIGLRVIEVIPEPLGYQTPVYLVMENGYVKDVYTRTSAEGDVFLKMTPKHRTSIEVLGQIYLEQKSCHHM